MGAFGATIPEGGSASDSRHWDKHIPLQGLAWLSWVITLCAIVLLSRYNWASLIMALLVLVCYVIYGIINVVA
eukprot:SAG11_NODE_33490_length_277_cov_0.578652_1_plen_73_part_00